MARKVILDVDPGVDDCLALCLALTDPRLEVVAVTATAGNVAGEQATRNIQAIIERIDPPRWPRIGTALVEDAPGVDRRHLHGQDGLSNTSYQVSELHHRHSSDKVICDEVRSSPGQVTILALGPLGNIAAAMQRDPSLATQIGHLIIRGGTFAGSGDVTAAAEFNFYCNPRAARAVIRSPVTKTLIPLDITQQAMLTYDFLDQLENSSSKTAALLGEVLPPAFRAHRQHLGLEGLSVDDTIAVIAAVENPLFETAGFSVDVETGGEVALGACIVDRRRLTEEQNNNADVAVACDTEAVLRCLIRGLLRDG